MEHLKINTNLKGLANLRKGKKVRITMGDHHLEVEPHRIKKALSAFKKNKGIHIQMSPEEIQHNEGMGLFDKIKSGIKGAVESVKHNAKPVGKQVLSKTVNILGTLAPAAAATAVTAVGQPHLALPASLATRVGVHYLEPMVQKKIAGLGIVDKVKDFMKTKLKKVNPRKVERMQNERMQNKRMQNDSLSDEDHMTQEQMDDQMPVNKKMLRDKYNEMMKHTTTGEGIIDDLGHLASHKVKRLMDIGSIPHDTIQEYIRKPSHLAPRSRSLGFDVLSPLATATTQSAKAHQELQHLERVMAKARMTGNGNFGLVGAGGNLLGMHNPALQSQPFGSNYQFATHLPPAYARLNKANGLYAQRRGTA